jgi:transcriptional regulator with XRE-family HTH domain
MGEIAHVKQNCKSQIVTAVEFDTDRFIGTLDTTRQARRLTWRKVADQAGVSASTLTRLSQGKRPDVDSLGALSHWAGVKADMFYRSNGAPLPTEPLAQAVGYLRADPNLGIDGANAMEAILRVTYEQLRKKE